MALRTSPEVGGMGHSIKRKEDPRFIRGKGTYVDDVVLPGMLWLDIVRSPYAHAKIVKIDIAKAMAVPGVLAVITGQDLAKYRSEEHTSELQSHSDLVCRLLLEKKKG